MIRQLDRQLDEWRKLSKKYNRPNAGWIKTLRLALCMSAEQLANRLGLKRSRIVQLENAEINDTITLRTLRKAANALGCDLVYALVPNDSTTLESIIRTRAEEIATDQINAIAHSMALEDQSIDKNILKIQREEFAKHFFLNPSKKLWRTQFSNEENPASLSAIFKTNRSSYIKQENPLKKHLIREQEKKYKINKENKK